MVLEVLMGDCEALRKRSRPVPGVDGGIVQLVSDLRDTMRACHMASLSAPQVGKPIQLFVTEVPGQTLVWINPEIIETNGHQDSVESCASFADVSLEVSRPVSLKVRTIQLDGSSVVRCVSGVLARLVAHEIDHLNGVLFQDHLDGDALFEQMLGSMGTSGTDEDTNEEPDEDDTSMDDSEWVAEDEEDALEDEDEDDSEQEDGDEVPDDDELQQVLDLLADGIWKVTLAAELLKDYDLEDEDMEELERLDRLGEALSKSLEHWEHLIGGHFEDTD